MRAFRMVRDNLRAPQGLPLSVRLMCDAHRLLLDGARGANKQPGALRRSQNRLGGSRPGEAAQSSSHGNTVPSDIDFRYHQRVN